MFAGPIQAGKRGEVRKVEAQFLNSSSPVSTMEGEEGPQWERLHWQRQQLGGQSSSSSSLSMGPSQSLQTTAWRDLLLPLDLQRHADRCPRPSEENAGCILWWPAECKCLEVRMLWFCEERAALLRKGGEAGGEEATRVWISGPGKSTGSTGGAEEARLWTILPQRVGKAPESEENLLVVPQCDSAGFPIGTSRPPPPSFYQSCNPDSELSVPLPHVPSLAALTPVPLPLPTPKESSRGRDRERAERGGSATLAKQGTRVDADHRKPQSSQLRSPAGDTRPRKYESQVSKIGHAQIIAHDHTPEPQSAPSGSIMPRLPFTKSSPPEAPLSTPQSKGRILDNVSLVPSPLDVFQLGAKQTRLVFGRMLLPRTPFPLLYRQMMLVSDDTETNGPFTLEPAVPFFPGQSPDRAPEGLGLVKKAKREKGNNGWETLTLYRSRPSGNRNTAMTDSQRHLIRSRSGFAENANDFADLCTRTSSQNSTASSPPSAWRWRYTPVTLERSDGMAMPSLDPATSFHFLRDGSALFRQRLSGGGQQKDRSSSWMPQWGSEPEGESGVEFVCGFLWGDVDKARNCLLELSVSEKCACPPSTPSVSDSFSGRGSSERGVSLQLRLLEDWGVKIGWNKKVYGHLVVAPSFEEGKRCLDVWRGMRGVGGVLSEKGDEKVVAILDRNEKGRGVKVGERFAAWVRSLDDRSDRSLQREKGSRLTEMKVEADCGACEMSCRVATGETRVIVSPHTCSPTQQSLEGGGRKEGEEDLLLEISFETQFLERGGKEGKTTCAESLQKSGSNSVRVVIKEEKGGKKRPSDSSSGYPVSLTLKEIVGGILGEKKGAQLGEMDLFMASDVIPEDDFGASILKGNEETQLAEAGGDRKVAKFKLPLTRARGELLGLRPCGGCRVTSMSVVSPECLPVDSTEPLETAVEVRIVPGERGGTDCETAVTKALQLRGTGRTPDVAMASESRRALWKTVGEDIELRERLKREVLKDEGKGERKVRVETSAVSRDVLREFMKSEWRGGEYRPRGEDWVEGEEEEERKLPECGDCSLRVSLSSEDPCSSTVQRQHDRGRARVRVWAVPGTVGALDCRSVLETAVDAGKGGTGTAMETADGLVPVQVERRDMNTGIWVKHKKTPSEQQVFTASLFPTFVQKVREDVLKSFGEEPKKQHGLREEGTQAQNSTRVESGAEPHKTNARQGEVEISLSGDTSLRSDVPSEMMRTAFGLQNCKGCELRVDVVGRSLCVGASPSFCGSVRVDAEMRGAQDGGTGCEESLREGIGDFDLPARTGWPRGSVLVSLLSDALADLARERDGEKEGSAGKREMEDRVMEVTLEPVPVKEMAEVLRVRQCGGCQVLSETSIGRWSKAVEAPSCVSVRETTRAFLKVPLRGPEAGGESCAIFLGKLAKGEGKEEAEGILRSLLRSRSREQLEILSGSDSEDEKEVDKQTERAEVVVVRAIAQDLQRQFLRREKKESMTRSLERTAEPSDSVPMISLGPSVSDRTERQEEDVAYGDRDREEEREVERLEVIVATHSHAHAPTDVPTEGDSDPSPTPSVPVSPSFNQTTPIDVERERAPAEGEGQHEVEPLGRGQKKREPEVSEEEQRTEKGEDQAAVVSAQDFSRALQLPFCRQSVSSCELEIPSDVSLSRCPACSLEDWPSIGVPVRIFPGTEGGDGISCVSLVDSVIQREREPSRKGKGREVGEEEEEEEEEGEEGSTEEAGRFFQAIKRVARLTAEEPRQTQTEPSASSSVDSEGAGVEEGPLAELAEGRERREDIGKERERKRETNHEGKSKHSSEVFKKRRLHFLQTLKDILEDAGDTGSNGGLSFEALGGQSLWKPERGGDRGRVEIEEGGEGLVSETEQEEEGRRPKAMGVEGRLVEIPWPCEDLRPCIDYRPVCGVWCRARRRRQRIDGPEGGFIQGGGEGEAHWWRRGDSSWFPQTDFMQAEEGQSEAGAFVQTRETGLDWGDKLAETAKGCDVQFVDWLVNAFRQKNGKGSGLPKATQESHRRRQLGISFNSDVERTQ
uniref:Uncharacterized protein n=1 Tax=Chromera velia CCMP2878 TaxID=1169474 RepID=A0A0K6S9Y4_9ALVE|eukprot:Cvel_8253.t2-p1 / transcript=Cvel_8253.t2 / gene=Cvel_8253 / organism=Chromera_velia_CCMP2878 / gene_product=hypothetical protein / transcript_product=hypothetical protein / location=Cvel_scaffold451:72570-87664(-) / protein_length=2019 / sequence_SO=supercontig / SO=protein_coding / is_pseudo=false